MQIAIRHVLKIGLGSGSAHAVQQMLLRPNSGPTQTVREWQVQCDGMAAGAHFLDAYGNLVDLVDQTKPEGDLVVSVNGVVTMHDRNGVLGRIFGEPPLALFKRVTPLTKASAGDFDAISQSGKGRIAVLHALMARVGETGGIQMQMQGGEEIGQRQSQSTASPIDLAHAFIGAARALDIPARFVQGYLADGEGECHAWAEAYDDAIGWIAFDPTHQLCPTDRHVRVAVGLDALSAALVRSVPMVGDVETVELSVTMS